MTDNLSIRFLKKEDAIPTQKLLNHKRILEHLKSQQFLEGIKMKISDPRGSLWGAFYGEDLVGVSELGTRNHSGIANNGIIGVLPEFRQKRVGSSLLFTQMLQSFLEGRRKVSDVIFHSNPHQKFVLPSLGYRLEYVMKKQTENFEDLHIYSYFVDEDFFKTPISRLPSNLVSIEVVNSEYTKKCWNERIIHLEAHKKIELADTFQRLRQSLFRIPVSICEYSQRQVDKKFENCFVPSDSPTKHGVPVGDVDEARTDPIRKTTDFASPNTPPTPLTGKEA